jgi:hypothetical protein
VDNSNDARVPALVKRKMIPIKAQNSAEIRISLRKDVRYQKINTQLVSSQNKTIFANRIVILRFHRMMKWDVILENEIQIPIINKFL